MTVLIPNSLDDALAMFGKMPSAQLLAGGTDFMVEVNFRHRQPSDVIVVRDVPELRLWSISDGVVHIGAGVPYRDMLSGPIAAAVPALAESARTVGSPQIRNAGTIGGSLGTCSPAGDPLPVLSALEAVVHLASVAGRRDLPIDAFMLGVKRNALGPGELVTGVSIPIVAGWQGYAKVGVRNAMVISTAGACVVVDRSERAVRCALGAVSPTIVRTPDAEAWVSAAIDWDDFTLPAGAAREFGRRAVTAARPIDDHRSTAAYRRHAIEVLAGRLLERAFS